MPGKLSWMPLVCWRSWWTVLRRPPLPLPLPRTTTPAAVPLGVWVLVERRNSPVSDECHPLTEDSAGVIDLEDSF